MRRISLHFERLRLVCITSVLCLMPVFVQAQANQKAAQPKPRIRISIPDMPRNVVKNQTEQKAKTQPATSKSKTVKQPTMTHQFEQSGLMKVPVIKAKKLQSKKGRSILMEHADKLSFDGFLNPDYQILSGNVRFKHEGAKLFSDSAHFYPKTNSLYCFGNVHMEQGDTLFLYGAWLFYDGVTKLAQIREKVRLENRQVTLFTDSLNYDRVSNLGYFFDGGLLVDGNNELSSEYGQYSPASKLAHFKNSVKLVNPQFTMINKELVYNTNTHIANIDVPTDIYSDSAYIFTNKGKYNTTTDEAELYNRSYVISDRRKLTGDTVYFNSKKSIGEAFGNVVLIDTTQQMTMIGGYGYSDEKQGVGLMSREPFLLEYSSKDTLWIHADTLKTVQDSIYKTVMAYHQARFFRNDFQGICDSLFYSTKDSIISFHGNPVLWSDKQQITGELIQMHTQNNKPKMLHIQSAAFLSEYVADSLYNQTSGKDLKAYFDSGKVVKVEIRGNAETIFLPIDENKIISGLNRLMGSSLDLYRKDDKIKKVVVFPKPEGKFYPLNLVESSVRYLDQFAWYGEGRPISPEDIFRSYRLPVKKRGSERSRRSNPSF